MDLKELLYFGSYIVSLAAAYYTLIMRVVRLEIKIESTEKYFNKLEIDLTEIKKEIKDLNNRLIK
jgi:cell division protein FtsB